MFSFKVQRAGAAALFAAVAFGGAGAVQAGEPLFGSLYTTDLLPKGKWEVEQWATYRFEKAGGDFGLFQGRTEVEYGISDRLQLGGYLNYAYTHVDHDGVDGLTAAPETFAEFPADPNRPYSRRKVEGLSAELIYRVLSPYKDPIGLALYVEPLVGPNTRELESRLIVQKNFMEDRLVLAGNITLSQEWRRLPADPEADPGSEEAFRHWDEETDVNLTVGASYRFAPSWYAGVEFANEREFAGFNFFDGSKATNSAFYIGPTIHYGGRRFFVTASYSTQLPWASDFANPAPGFIKDGFTYADDFERHRLRVKVGYTF